MELLQKCQYLYLITCCRDCESKVPPSCGLPPEFVTAFKEKFHKDGNVCVFLVTLNDLYKVLYFLITMLLK